MTLATTDNRASYSGNDVTTVFAFPYLFFANTDLVVSLITDATSVTVTQVLDTDYTLTGAGTATEGELTMTTAPATGETLLINRSVPYTQDTDYIEGDAFPAETHETALDKLTVLCQQLLDETERTFRFGSAYAGGADPELPDPLPLNYLRWTADGTALENTTSVSSVVASDVPYTATGGIVATNVQAAITELDTEKQPLDADLTAISGLTSAANKIIRYTGSETADLVDFLDEDTMSSDSATAVASQQSVKAYGRCNPIREDSTTETVPSSVHGQITEAALTSSITKTLPDITTVPDGAQYGFRIKSTTGSYTLSIVPTGSDNIDVYNVAGHDSFVMANVGDFVMFVADVSDTAWKITVDKCAGPHFRASRINSAQSLGLGSFVKAQYNTEDSDIWGYYDPTTNYRHTPLIPGLYEYKCAAHTATDTAGRIALMIYKNGTLHEYGSRIYTTSDGVNVGCWEVEMNGSTDYVEIYVRSLDAAGDFGSAATIESYFKGRRKTLG